MCGRYYVDNEEENIKVRAILAEIAKRSLPMYDQVRVGEIFPSQIAPVIVYEKGYGVTVRPMKWGFPRTGGGGLVINSRSEKNRYHAHVSKGRAGAAVLDSRKPFFEWRRVSGRKTKDKYAFRPDNEEPLMYMAGVYGEFLGGFAGGGYDGFAILTRAADWQMTPYHDRMPVILMEEDLKKAWLNHDIAFADLRPAFEPPTLLIWEQPPDEKRLA